MKWYALGRSTGRRERMTGFAVSGLAAPFGQWGDMGDGGDEMIVAGAFDRLPRSTVFPLLVNHDLALVASNAVRWQVGAGGLYIDATIDTDAPGGDLVHRALQAGRVTGLSITFVPSATDLWATPGRDGRTKHHVLLVTRLLEISVIIAPEQPVYRTTYLTGRTIHMSTTERPKAKTMEQRRELVDYLQHGGAMPLWMRPPAEVRTELRSATEALAEFEAAGLERPAAMVLSLIHISEPTRPY